MATKMYVGRRMYTDGAAQLDIRDSGEDSKGAILRTGLDAEARSHRE